MRSSPRSLLSAALIFSLPLLFAGKGKCRAEPEIIGPTDTQVVTPPAPDPEVQVQVVSVSPSTLKATVRTPIHVYGAGFESGMSVKIGAFNVGTVTFVDANTLQVITPGLPQGVHDLVVTHPKGGSATLRAAIRAEEAVDHSCRRMAMYFDLDAAGLSQPVKVALDKAIVCLKGQSSIRLEGHADERGTTDYNIALAQRRALSVQNYLVQKGIGVRKLPVISYGEEKPADSSRSETAWAKNRRVELVSQ